MATPRKKPEDRLPLGRPSKYTPDLAKLFCTLIAGGKSMRTICKAAEMPEAGTIFDWLAKYPDFQQHYAQACEERANALAEEALEISDDSVGDYIDTEKGRIFQGENVQRARLRVDTRKWFAGQLAPKKWGARTVVAGDANAPLKVEHQHVDVRQLSEDVRDAFKQAMLQVASKTIDGVAISDPSTDD